MYPKETEQPMKMPLWPTSGQEMTMKTAMTFEKSLCRNGFAIFQRGFKSLSLRQNKTTSFRMWSYFDYEGIWTHLHACVRWTRADTSANTGGYLNFRKAKMQTNPSRPRKYRKPQPAGWGFFISAVHPTNEGSQAQLPPVLVSAFDCKVDKPGQPV